MIKSIQQFDQWLLQTQPYKSDHPAWEEAVYFCLKQIRAGLLAGLLLLAFLIIPTTGILGIAQDDIVFGLAIGLQVWTVKSKLHNDAECKMLLLFYILGLILECFISSTSGINPSLPVSWSSIHGVPLVNGFIYVALASYIMQAWRLFSIRIRYYPPYWMAIGLASVTYLYFISQTYVGEYTGYLAAGAVGLYAPSKIMFKSHQKERQAPLLFAALLVCLFTSFIQPISLGSNASQSIHTFLLIIIGISVIIHYKHLKPA